jgi:hypothetical protein
MRIGEIELLVETVPVAGSEQTSTIDRAGQGVVDAFDRAQDAIVEVACSVAQTVSRLAARAARPDRVEVEFGLKFTAKGNVIIAGGEAEGALRVLIGYDSAGDHALDTTGTRAAGSADDTHTAP